MTMLRPSPRIAKMKIGRISRPICQAARQHRVEQRNQDGDGEEEDVGP